jgi:hypothetical protein
MEMAEPATKRKGETMNQFIHHEDKAARRYINLNDLAFCCAVSDNPAKRNEDIIAAKSALAQLGIILRGCRWWVAVAICWAIFRRAGRKSL